MLDYKNVQQTLHQMQFSVIPRTILLQKEICYQYV